MKSTQKERKKIPWYPKVSHVSAPVPLPPSPHHSRRRAAASAPRSLRVTHWVHKTAVQPMENHHFVGKYHHFARKITHHFLGKSTIL